MLDGTYAGMTASIADFLNRSDLSATIPDFIVLAEAELNRKLRTRLATGSAVLSLSGSTVALPADFAAAISVTNSNGEPLNVRTPDALALLSYANSNLSGIPTDYAIVGANLSVYPTASPVANATLTYYQKLPPLALNTAGNWVSLNHPDAYLYGALVATAPYLQADDRVQVWGELFEDTIASILEADRGRFGERLTPQPSVTQII
jgi:hypothetical protein